MHTVQLSSVKKHPLKLEPFNIQLYLCYRFDPRMVPFRTMKFITLPLTMMGPITKALQNPGSKRNHVTCCPGVWGARMKKKHE